MSTSSCGKKKYDKTMNKDEHIMKNIKKAEQYSGPCSVEADAWERMYNAECQMKNVE